MAKLTETERAIATLLIKGARDEIQKNTTGGRFYPVAQCDWCKKCGAGKPHNAKRCKVCNG